MIRFKDVFSRWFEKDPEMHYDIRVTLLDRATQKPIGGEGYEVRFYDEDKDDNDFLGAGPISAEGVVDVRFDPKNMQKGQEDEENETKPDVFFRLVKDGKVLFTSKTIPDVDFDTQAGFDMKGGKEVDLGTYLISLEEN